MIRRPVITRRLSKYISTRFIKALLLCLSGLTLIYLLVEFFERLDNLIAQNLSFWIMIQYLFVKAPQIIFEILPVAILMATLLTLGTMARDNELIAFLSGGFSLYQIIIPLIIIFLVFGLLSGLYLEFWAPALTQRSLMRLAQIKGEKPQKKLSHGRIWLAGKQGRIFNIRFIDIKNQSLKGVTIFEVNNALQIKRRWNIKECSYKNELWDLQDFQIWRFENEVPEAESGEKRIVAWPERFSDFSSLQKDTKEMRYTELKNYIKRLEEWGYKTYVQKTDLYFKFAFPLTCLIFGLLGIPFALHLHRGVKYFSIGISLVIAVTYWVIMNLAISMAHAGILPPIIGAWAVNIIFCVLALGFVSRTMSSGRFF